MSSAPVWWFYLTIVAAAAGVVIAIIRTRIANRQKEIEQNSSDIDKQRLSDEKFKMGVELFGNDLLSVRVGGVYVLADLAKLEPERNHVRVMDIFISFLSDPPRFKEGPREGEADYTGPDTAAIVKAISNRSEKQTKAETQQGYGLQRKLRTTDFELIDGELELKRTGMGPRPRMSSSGHSRARGMQQRPSKSNWPNPSEDAT